MFQTRSTHSSKQDLPELSTWLFQGVDNRKQVLSQCMQLYALKQQRVKTCLQSFGGSEGNPRPGLSQVMMLDC